MWAYIERATQGEQGRGVAVMLTTHSMEECEALCSRVGIMHAGRLACLASSTRLKHLYGDGYLMEVRHSSLSRLCFKLLVACSHACQE